MNLKLVLISDNLSSENRQQMEVKYVHRSLHRTAVAYRYQVSTSAVSYCPSNGVDNRLPPKAEPLAFLFLLLGA